MKEAIELSEAIFGWTRGEEAVELARLSAAAPVYAVIVEIGSFLGSGTVLLAAPRRTVGSGMVYAVDPFDGSGDSFSIPYYAQAIERLGGETQKQYFDRAVTVSGVAAFVETHVGTAVDMSRRPGPRRWTCCFSTATSPLRGRPRLTMPGFRS